nr:GDYXXLXY domain-containing protein [uncultured Cohaesibacter sp.]
MMRHLILLALLPILLVLNYSVLERELLRNNGELVLLELAPVDPRSLMQGDYMRLQYSLVQQASTAWRTMRNEARGGKVGEPKGRLMVIELDESARARFARFYSQGEGLAQNERLIAFQFHPDGGSRSIRLLPQSFFFQEGQASHFEKARFGMMHLGPDGDHILVGLADEAGRQIKP